MKKIGIFGGTFNPPHLGHIRSAIQAREQLGLEQLIIIPTGLPPHKSLPENSPSPDQRLEMLRLSAKSLSDTVISDIEMSREGISFTADTLRTLRLKHPDAQFWLIMGGDMFLTIKKWYQSDYILKNASVAVFAREQNDCDITDQINCLKREYGIDTFFIPCEPLVISSTELREQLRRREGLEYLQPEVYHYIIKNRLYGAKPSFDWLTAKALERHDPKRIPHVLGTEREAVRLAKRWNCDDDEARPAALLHDITKKLNYAEQLLLCERYGIITDSVERRTEKLLHAKTGAYVAYHEFGASSDVFQAIYWHTTGKADMSMLEKILYIADYIEPTRNFTDLSELRSLAYEDLNAALIRGLEMSIQDMKERGVSPHPKSHEALSFLIGE
jgi:nicotinate-nucleotide adenylyltransferase